MKKPAPLIIKNREAFLRSLADSKKRNFEDNLKFVKLRAEWISKVGNEEWSRRQKILLDSIYEGGRQDSSRLRHKS